MSWCYRTFRYKLRPTDGQSNALARAAGARRFVFNWALARWREHYREHGTSPPINELYRALTDLRHLPEYTWLTEVSSHLQQQAIADVRAAYRGFFSRRTGYPRFRSRKRDAARFRIPAPVKVNQDRLWVPRIGWIRMRVSRPLHGELRSATFRRDVCGRWSVAILTRVERPPECAVTRERTVGIDLGLVDFAVLSDGTRVAAPRFAARADARRRREQRRLARKQRGSRNSMRQRRRLARVCRRAVVQRADFLHKLSTRPVREFDVICVETLDVRGLARTKLSKGVLDAAWGEFLFQLRYKAALSGKRVVAVGRFFPSSKRCARCGSVNALLSRSVRVWRCPCGACLDRDLNAADNLREEGLRLLVAAGCADTENARGAWVRPPMEAPGDETGIPVGAPNQFDSGPPPSDRPRRGGPPPARP